MSSDRERLRAMHRRAQRAEGALKAAWNELNLAEQYYMNVKPNFLLGRTIRDVRKALLRAGDPNG